MRKPVVIVDQFHKEARALRGHFDERFADPLDASPGRFVWDYWHVPGQYTALRTPAYHFFPPKMYRAFHERLVLWGRENLGCHDVSPPWLSLYVDGCRQELHSDLPHGPWAFVYSLTPWEKRKFRGGETMMLQEPMLDLWNHLDAFRGLEEESVLRTIDPKFNRLTVFDPRVPHGVRRVEDVLDPREGRLVIHGWFVQPRPFIEGPLPKAALKKLIDGLLEEIDRELAGEAVYRGILSLRFQVTASGTVSMPRVLSNTIVAPGGDPKAATRLERLVIAALRRVRLPHSRGVSKVTLPLVFEA